MTHIYIYAQPTGSFLHENLLVLLVLNSSHITNIRYTGLYKYTVASLSAIVGSFHVYKS